tara:strand:+ start:55 stop:402 length:348 start_codon:yes stop_codon:yes gene_type:complete
MRNPEIKKPLRRQIRDAAQALGVSPEEMREVIRRRCGVETSAQASPDRLFWVWSDLKEGISEEEGRLVGELAKRLQETGPTPQRVELAMNQLTTAWGIILLRRRINALGGSYGQA